MIEKMVVKKRQIRERTPARRGVQRSEQQVEQAGGAAHQAGAGEANASQSSAAVRPQTH